MPNLNPNQRIYDVLKDIERGVYRLPNIQRGFEWDEDRICKLLDSVLHEYPIGAIMVWLPPETIHKDIQTRPFVKDFDTTQDYLSQAAHPSHQESYLVLDGQQRLQSLYLAFFGTYNNRRIYFQIDHASSPEADGDGPFELLTVAEANTRLGLVHPAQLIQLDYRTKSEFAEQSAATLCADIDDPTLRVEKQATKRAAMMQNIDLFIESFNMRPAFLIQEVAHRHSYDQVLEIFQRVNSGGMTLSKSDLMFCTLKLKIQDMEERFSDALRTINQVGRYSFTRDFLIKASLVLFGQGAQYEVNKLKNDSFIAKLRDGFDDLDHCLRHLVTWLETTARINNARFLRSDNALIPILDYMYHSGKHDQPEGADSRSLVHYLYMAFLTRLFSRGGDRTLDQLHTRITQAQQTSPGVFPIGVVREYICKRMNVSWELAEHHFADDPELMLNIVDNGALQLNAHRHEDQKLERDHIFPRKVVTDHGLGDLADHIGNYRLIVMPINRRKKANMPTTTDFYGRNDEVLEPLYQAAIANLTRETFQSFRDERAARIVTAVNEFLDLDQVGTADGASAPVTATAQSPVQTAPASQSDQLLPADARTPAPFADTRDQRDATIATDGSRLNVEGLRSAYHDDSAVRLLVDHFGSRQRNQTVSPVDTLERALEAAGTSLARHIIIDALRRLDAVGVGRFIPGRKGYPTRFEWKMKSLQTRALAAGDQASEHDA
jgi:Protein of unknown function DUF262